MTNRSDFDPTASAAAYALGALDPEESRAFEQALEQSPALQREVAEYREVASLLAQDRATPLPRPEVWRRIGDRVRDDDTSAPARRYTPLVAGLGWAAAAAALIAAGMFGSRSARLSTVAAQRALEADSLAARLGDREDLLAEILGANQVITLTSADRAEPAIRIYWNRGSDRWVIHAANLNAAGASRVYQLWFIQNGQPVPSITFNTDASGAALFTAALPTDTTGLTAAAITEEPAGGSTQPTLPILFVGEVDP